MADFAADFAASREPAPTDPAQPANDSLATFRDNFEHFRQQQFREQGRLRASASLAAQTTPEAVAAQRRLAAITGVPLEVVKTAEGEAKALATYEELRAASAYSPVLRDRLQNPNFAALAQKDTKPLSSLEALFGAFAGGVVKDAFGRTLTGFGRLYDITARAIAAPIIAIGGDRARQVLETPLPVPDPSTLFFKRPGQILQNVGENMQPPPDQRNFATDVAGGLGQVAGQIGMYIATGGTGALTTLLAQGVDVMGEKVEKDDAPQGLKDTATLAGGIVTALTEKYALDKILGPLAVPIKNAIGAAVARIGIAAATEGGQEMIESIGQDVIRKVMTDPNAQIDLGDVAYEGGVGATVGGIVRTLVESALHIRARGRQQEVKRAQDEIARIQELLTVAGGSQVREVDHQTFAEFAQAAADANPNAPKAVYVDGRVLADALAQSGMDQAQLEQMLPSVWGQIEDAIATNTPVEIPIGEALATLPGTPLEAALLPELRMSPEGLSLNEAKDAQKQAQELLQQEADRVIQQAADSVTTAASMETVRIRIKQDLDATGRFSEDVNDKGARLVSQFYTVMGERMGMRPEQLYDEMLQYRVAREQSQVQESTLSSEAVAAEQASIAQRIGEIQTELDTLRAAPAGEGEQTGKAPADAAQALPVVQAGDVVDGRTVREDVPNMSSIEASVENPQVLPGVREVPLSSFDPQYVSGITYEGLDARTRELADAIRQSGEINPLIVGVDSSGYYIIEGGHRFDALIASGAKSLPAVVVLDQEQASTPAAAPAASRVAELEAELAALQSRGQVLEQQAVEQTLRSRIGMDFRDVVKRTPELQTAIQQLLAGEITRDEFDAVVNQAKPVTPYTEVPAPASTDDMRNALTSDKVDRLGVPGQTLEEGHPVGLRLDIPAYSQHGTWVVSIHEQQAGYNAGKSIGYEAVARATDVSFGVVERAAANIAGGKPKATIAVMKGGWKPTTPEHAKADADAALNDPAWVQVGMDPERHSYFYDRATMQPVVAADEVIQIGPLVLAKNPTYAPKSDFLFQEAAPANDAVNPSFDAQADQLKADIAATGNTVVDTLQVDQLIDSKDIKTLTMQDLVGLSIFPTIADRTGAAALYTGIDSSRLDVAIALLGGPFFPLRKSNAQAGVAWSNRGEGVIAQKAAKLKEGANYMLVVLGDANMHQSNTTMSHAFMSTLHAYQRDGRISAENMDALADLVRTTGEKAIEAERNNSEKAAKQAQKLEEAQASVTAKTAAVAAADQRLKQAIAKQADAKAALESASDKAKAQKAYKNATNAVTRAQTSLENAQIALSASQERLKLLGEGSVVNQQLIGFPGFDDVDIAYAYMDGISFDARKRIMDIMASKAAQSLGAPPMQRILDAVREPSLAGHRWGDGILLLEVDQQNPQVTLGENGTLPHPDYPLGVRGRVVGKLNAPINWTLLWQDWLAANSDLESPRRAFELAKPIVTVTQDLVDRIGAINQQNIDGARQARLAADFAAGNWRTSDDDVKRGGVSPQEFLDALMLSDAKDTLTQYTLAELKQGIKDGTKKIYQLGNGQIFFLLETRPDGSKYLASVVNNEQGARGIGAPAVVLKALEEGATDLDAFAVKSPKYPDGFLPSLYGAFGFEVTNRYTFDPQYFQPQLSEDQRRLALADAVNYWQTSTSGFDPQAGMPDAVEMKWSGTDEDRRGITERYFRSGIEGLLAGRVEADVRAFVADARQPDQEAPSEGGAAPVGGRVAGDQGVGPGASVASRARLVVQGIANLTDAELANLDLTVEDRDAVRRALGTQPRDALAQSSVADIPKGALEILSDLERAKFVPDKAVLAMLGDFPGYLQGVVDFMVEQREKLVTGKLTVRDLAKAYYITIASMGADAILVNTLEQKTGMKVDPIFINDGKVRPEEAAAAWLMTPDGKQALDDLEAGKFNAALWDKGAGVRRAFGDDRFATFRAFSPDAKGINFLTLSELLPEINAAGQAKDFAQLEKLVNRMNGIGRGKIGFIKHMLGMGDSPTIDAVEINFWITGQGDVGQLDTKPAQLARDVKRVSSDRRISALMYDRIFDRFNRLRGKVPGGKDIDQGVYQHIMHHWLWDRAKGIETTHEGMYHALRLAQATPAGPRGTYDIASMTTVLNGTADLSTFLHETGHFFLDAMRRMVLSGKATPEVTEMYRGTLKALGVSEEDWNRWHNEYELTGKISDGLRKAHEKWAESFELYLFTGKAPSPEVRGLFRTFAAWLKRVYRSIQEFTTRTGTTLDPDLAAVMDRMLATDAQIAEAEEIAGLLPNLDANAEAQEKLNARSLRDLKWAVNARDKMIAKLQREVEKLRKAVQAEIQGEVEQMPVYRAMTLLRTGRLPGDEENMTNAQRKSMDTMAGMPIKLGLPQLKEMYGEGPAAPWRYLPTGKGGLAAAEGVHPDVLADALGFESGDALVRALLAAEPMPSVVEGMTDQRMLERYGDLATPEAIADAASEAVHNQARARALATELAAQRDMLNARRDTGQTNARGGRVTVNVLMEAAKSFAENVIGRRRIKDLKKAIWSHTQAERRAGRDWERATAKADTKAAVQAKQDQVLNNAAVRAGHEAQAQIKKALELFKRVTRGTDEKLVERGYDPDIANAARAILAAYGIAPTKGKSAVEYLEILQRSDPVTYGAVAPSVNAALMNAKPFDELTVDELGALVDEVQSLWHLARRSRQMEVDGDLLDREDVQAELKQTLEDRGIPDTVPGDTSAMTPGEQAMRKLYTFRAAATRVESWAQNLGATFTRFVFQPVKEAANRYRADKTRYLQRYRELIEAIGPSLRRQTIDAPELGYTFGKDTGGVAMSEILHAILHTGNASNKRKLLLGRGWAAENADGTLDTTQWDAFIQRMIDEGTITKAHFDFAQGVWDMLESMKPMAQKTHRDVFGRYFAEVTADAFDTPFGSYRGGYVPAMVDARIVPDAATRELAEQENQSMTFAFPATARGFTKARVEYNRPLMLDLRTLAQHIDKVLLFSHLESPVRDVRRILTAKEVAYGLNRIDPVAFDNIITPWLNRAARQQVETPVPGDAGLMRVFSAARNRAGLAAMFANVANAAQQLTGFSIAAVRVQPRHLLAATGEMLAHPKRTKAAVADASIYMRERMENETSNAEMALREILLDPSVYERAQTWSARHAYFLQQAVDNSMGPIIWTAAFNQATEQGKSERDAVRFADSVIRTTQGSTLPEDISRIEGGNAFVRMFTQFASYFNMQANLLGTEFAKTARELGVRNGAGRMLYVALLGFLAPAWVAEAIMQAFRGGPDDEDKDGEYLDDWLAAVLGWGTLRNATALIPAVGPVINAGFNNWNNQTYDDRIASSPAIGMIEAAVRAPSSVYKAIVEDGNRQRAVRDVAALITLSTGLPVATAARPLGYLAGMSDSRINPTDELDMLRGLTTGVASPQSK